MAEADDLVVKNYARRAFRTTKRLSKSQRAHQKDAFTVEEVATLLEKLPEDLLGNSIRLMLVTGLRLQELLALTPKDIAADGSVVYVSKAVKMVEGIPKLGSPKSFTSRRVVPVAPIGCGRTGARPFSGAYPAGTACSTPPTPCGVSTISCWPNTPMFVPSPHTAADTPM